MKDLLSQNIQRAINKADCSGKIPLGGWVSDMCANVIKHSLDNEATDSESDEETSPIPPASHLSRCGLSGNHPTNLSHSAAAQTTPSDQPGLPAGWGATVLLEQRVRVKTLKMIIDNTVLYVYIPPSVYLDQHLL